MGKQQLSIIPARAVYDREMPKGALLTLNAIGMFANRNGWCYPSLRALAEACGVSRSTISRHIKWLEKHGYLRVVPQRNPDGSRAPNRIQIIYDAPENQQTDEAEKAQEVEGGVALKVQQGVALKSETPVALKMQQGVAPRVQRGVALKDATLTSHINDIENAPDGAAVSKSDESGKGARSGKKKTRRQRKQPAHVPEPIAIYRKWAGLYPKKTLWNKINSVVKDYKLWDKVVEGWISVGWKPTNIAGMLDFYKRGEIPGTKMARSQSQNPQNQSKPRDAREVLKELGL